MAWGPAPVDGLPDRTFRRGGGVHRAWVRQWQHLSVFAHLQHRDFSKPQNLFCSRHYWLCVQLLILEDLQWLGWGLCAERVAFMLRSATRVLFVHELRPEWSEKTSRFIHSSVIRVTY